MYFVKADFKKGSVFVQTGKYTDFGLCVKTELLRRGWEQQKLERKVTEETGLYVDGGYMYKILTGQRQPQKIIDSICKILEIQAPQG